MLDPRQMLRAWRRALVPALAVLAVLLASCDQSSQVAAFPPTTVCRDARPAAVQAPLDVTFLAESDTHLGGDLEAPWLGSPVGASPPRMEAVQRYVAQQANTIEGRAWPAELGGQVEKPLGMVIAGDLTEDGTAAQWSAFERVYGSSPQSGLLKMPVAESVGNHDHRLGNDDVAAQVTRRHGSVAYSVDWGPLHVVSLGEEPTDASLVWLRRDLACVPPSAPIVLFFHKPVAGPFSAGGFLSFNANAQALLSTIQGHDVVAILHGHVHRTGPYEWHGIPVYVTGSAKNEARSFLVVRITDDRLQVAAWNYEFGDFWWWEQRPRHGAGSVPRVQGKRAYDGREPLVPYPVDPSAVW